MSLSFLTTWHIKYFYNVTFDLTAFVKTLEGLNAGILCAQMIATGDSEIFKKTDQYKENLKMKIVKANQELRQEKFKFKTN